MLPRNYYQILGVDPQAGPPAIKSAYRRLARRYHPDVAKRKDARVRFLAVQEAYDVLSNPARRREYDRILASAARQLLQFATRRQQGAAQNLRFGRLRPTEGLGSFSTSSAFALTLERYSARSNEERSGERL